MSKPAAGVPMTGSREVVYSQILFWFFIFSSGACLRSPAPAFCQSGPSASLPAGPEVGHGFGHGEYVRLSARWSGPSHWSSSLYCT